MHPFSSVFSSARNNEFQNSLRTRKGRSCAKSSSRERLTIDERLSTREPNPGSCERVFIKSVRSRHRLFKNVLRDDMVLHIQIERFQYIFCHTMDQANLVSEVVSRFVPHSTRQLPFVLGTRWTKFPIQMVPKQYVAVSGEAMIS